MPASLTVAAGSTSATFTIATSTVSASVQIGITASAGGVSLVENITVTPTITIATFTVSPDLVWEHDSTTGTVTLSSQAPAGGTVVSLVSEGVDGRVPDTFTIAAGETVGTFTIETSGVSAITEVRVRASVGSDSKSVQIRVRPRTTPTTTPAAAGAFSLKGGT